MMIEAKTRLDSLTKWFDNIDNKTKNDNYIHSQLIREAELIETIRFSTNFSIDPTEFNNDYVEIAFFYKQLIEELSHKLKVTLQCEFKVTKKHIDLIIDTKIYDTINGKKFFYINSHYVLQYNYKFYTNIAINPHYIEEYSKNQAFGFFTYHSECNTIYVLKFGIHLSEKNDDSGFFRVSDFAHEEIYIPEFEDENLFSDFQIDEDLDFVNTDGAMQATITKKLEGK